MYSQCILQPQPTEQLIEKPDFINRLSNSNMGYASLVPRRVHLYWEKVKQPFVSLLLFYIPLHNISKLVTVVEGDPRVPFSIVTTPRCREGFYSLAWIFPLYLWYEPDNRYQVPFFKSMPRHGIEPRSSGPLANTVGIVNVAERINVNKYNELCSEYKWKLIYWVNLSRKLFLCKKNSNSILYNCIRFYLAVFLNFINY